MRAVRWPIIRTDGSRIAVTIRRVWAARFEDGRLKEMPEIVKPNVRPSCFGEDNAGEIYYADYDTGYLYTLEKNDAGGWNGW